MMNDIRIKLGSLEDLSSIVFFQQQMALETEDKILTDEVIYDGVKAVIQDSEKGYYVLATIQEKVIASLMVTLEWSDWRNGCFWWIQSVYVLPEYRRKGIY